MAKARLPQELPGRFFVLNFNEFTEDVTIIMDDGEQSSYIIGTVLEAHNQLKMWKVNALMAGRAIDYAKEFKAPVQCIPSQNRTISLRDRTDTRELDFQDGNLNTWLHNV